MSDSTPGGLREILRQVWLNGAELTPSITVDEAIAAIEALVPEKHGTAGYDYWRGHDDAIDQIQRNFKGE